MTNDQHKQGDQDQRFPKQARILNQAQFDRVYQGKAYAADDTLVINGVLNEESITRLGLSVSRKVGNAVVRNRWKRKIRDCFRRQKSDLPVGLDIVVRPRRGAKCDHAAIQKSISNLVAKIHRRLNRA